MNRRQLLGGGALLCGLANRAAAAPEQPGWNEEWPGWRGPARDGVWPAGRISTSLPEGKLPVVWRRPVAGGYNGPTIAAGRAVVMDRVQEPEERERIHCFDAASGEPIWMHEYPASYAGISYPDGPRAAVELAGGRAYALGAAGMLHALDLKSGRVLWRRDLNREYRIRMPDWGIAAAPLLVDDMVVVQAGGEKACLVALERESGAERWKALEDRASYSAPILIKQGGRRLILCLTGDRIVAVDPAQGRLVWSEPFPPKRWVIGIATPVVQGGRLFISTAGEGSHLYQLLDQAPWVRKLWGRVGPNERSTDALQVVMSTPIFEGEYLYGIDYYGELRCLRASDGERVWTHALMPQERWATAHMVRQGETTWMLTERGDLVAAQLSPAGYREIDRAHLIDPTTGQLPQRGGVVWSHPGFARGHIYARNDKEILCADLRAG